MFVYGFRDAADHSKPIWETHISDMVELLLYSNKVQ
jgi:hypothetical protein